MKNENGILETNGARIYYEVEGDGPALVLIHQPARFSDLLRDFLDQVAART